MDTPTTKTTPISPLEGPLSLSTALSLSMGTSEELDQAIGLFTDQNQLTGLGGERERRKGIKIVKFHY